MKITEESKNLLFVLLFFSVIGLISYYLTKPIEQNTSTKEELYQIAKDSLLDEQIKKEIDSTYNFDHSKITK